MSIEVKPRLNAPEELNLLLRLIPLNHPAKTEVSSFLSQITNVQSGLKPDGTPYLPGEIIPSVEEGISRLTMGALLDKGFSVLIKNPTAQETAVKSFVLSAIKDGENVDVGSLAAAFLPSEAMSLMSKVLQTEVIGKNIFQLKDIGLKRLKDIQGQVSSITKQTQGAAGLIATISSTFGELPEISNALAEMTVISTAITDIETFITNKMAEVETSLALIENIASNVPTTTLPPEVPALGELPVIPPSVLDGDIPKPDYENEDVLTDEEEEESNVTIFE